jgi:DNA-binding NtrC family response regulator
VSFTVGQTTLRFESLPSNIREPLSASERFGDVLGRSASIRRLFALLPRIAASDSTVLIEGETGTGKTLLASSIHEASGRAKEPFVVFDCGAVAPTLIESELFGHERGAFSGAIAAREGAFVAARRGTLFLDELGELPLELQPKLLRALSERTIVPLGSRVPREVDARVIAATNRDLRERVNQGHFRADLFYRVAVVRLAIPPLRERPDDIELLARHFYAECCPEAPEPPAEWLEVWKRLSWRGNVRELRSAVERIVLFGEEQPSEAQAAPKDTLSFRAAKERVIESFEREYLQRLLARAAGNVSKAARIARMDRNHLRELLRRHGLEPHR